jgi:hypothetical protein
MKTMIIRNEVLIIDIVPKLFTNVFVKEQLYEAECKSVASNSSI